MLYSNITRPLELFEYKLIFESMLLDKAYTFERHGQGINAVESCRDFMLCKQRNSNLYDADLAVSLQKLLESCDINTVITVSEEEDASHPLRVLKNFVLKQDVVKTSASTSLTVEDVNLLFEQFSQWISRAYDGDTIKSICASNSKIRFELIKKFCAMSPQNYSILMQSQSLPDLLYQDFLDFCKLNKGMLEESDLRPGHEGKNHLKLIGTLCCYMQNFITKWVVETLPKYTQKDTARASADGGWDQLDSQFKIDRDVEDTNISNVLEDIAKVNNKVYRAHDDYPYYSVISWLQTVFLAPKMQKFNKDLKFFFNKNYKNIRGEYDEAKESFQDILPEIVFCLSSGMVVKGETKVTGEGIAYLDTSYKLNKFKGKDGATLNFINKFKETLQYLPEIYEECGSIKVENLFTYVNRWSTTTQDASKSSTDKTSKFYVPGKAIDPESERIVQRLQDRYGIDALPKNKAIQEVAMIIYGMKSVMNLSDYLESVGLTIMDAPTEFEMVTNKYRSITTVNSILTTRGLDEWQFTEKFSVQKDNESVSEDGDRWESIILFSDGDIQSLMNSSSKSIVCLEDEEFSDKNSAELPTGAPIGRLIGTDNIRLDSAEAKSIITHQNSIIRSKWNEPIFEANVDGREQFIAGHNANTKVHMKVATDLTLASASASASAGNSRDGYADSNQADTETKLNKCQALLHKKAMAMTAAGAHTTDVQILNRITVLVAMLGTARVPEDKLGLCTEFNEGRSRMYQLSYKVYQENFAQSQVTGTQSKDAKEKVKKARQILVKEIHEFCNGCIQELRDIPLYNTSSGQYTKDARTALQQSENLVKDIILKDKSDVQGYVYTLGILYCIYSLLEELEFYQDSLTAEAKAAYAKLRLKNTIESKTDAFKEVFEAVDDKLLAQLEEESTPPDVAEDNLRSILNGKFKEEYRLLKDKSGMGNASPSHDIRSSASSSLSLKEFKVRYKLFRFGKVIEEQNDLHTFLTAKKFSTFTISDIKGQQIDSIITDIDEGYRRIAQAQSEFMMIGNWVLSGMEHTLVIGGYDVLDVDEMKQFPAYARKLTDLCRNYKTITYRGPQSVRYTEELTAGTIGTGIQCAKQTADFSNYKPDESMLIVDDTFTCCEKSTSWTSLSRQTAVQTAKKSQDAVEAHNECYTLTVQRSRLKDFENTNRFSDDQQVTSELKISYYVKPFKRFKPKKIFDLASVLESGFLGNGSINTAIKMAMAITGKFSMDTLNSLADAATILSSLSTISKLIPNLDELSKEYERLLETFDDYGAILTIKPRISENLFSKNQIALATFSDLYQMLMIKHSWILRDIEDYIGVIKEFNESIERGTANFEIASVECNEWVKSLGFTYNMSIDKNLTVHRGVCRVLTDFTNGVLNAKVKNNVAQMKSGIEDMTAVLNGLFKLKKSNLNQAYKSRARFLNCIQTYEEYVKSMEYQSQLMQAGSEEVDLRKFRKRFECDPSTGVFYDKDSYKYFLGTTKSKNINGLFEYDQVADDPNENNILVNSDGMLLIYKDGIESGTPSFSSTRLSQVASSVKRKLLY